MRQPLDNEKNTTAPVFFELTNHKKSMRIKFMITLPIPIPIMSLFVRIIEIPAIPYRADCKKAIAQPCIIINPSMIKQQVFSTETITGTNAMHAVTKAFTKRQEMSLTS